MQYFTVSLLLFLSYNSSGKYQIQSGKRAVLSKAEPVSYTHLICVALRKRQYPHGKNSVRICGKAAEQGDDYFFPVLLQQGQKTVGKHDSDTADLSSDCTLPELGIR